MCASWNSRLRIVNLLLQAGANVDGKEYGNTGETELMKASNFGLQSLAFAHKTNRFGLFAVHRQAGAKVDEKNKDGFTALIIASGNGHKGIVGLLLAITENFDKKKMVVGQH